MRDHEERCREAAVMLGILRSVDDEMSDESDIGTMSVQELAAALRSAEESAARRCAEIAAPPHGEGCGYLCNLCATCKRIRAAIRSEFGLGEEGA